MPVCVCPVFDGKCAVVPGVCGAALRLHVKIYRAMCLCGNGYCQVRVLYTLYCAVTASSKVSGVLCRMCSSCENFILLSQSLLNRWIFSATLHVTL